MAGNQGMYGYGNYGGALAPAYVLLHEEIVDSNRASLEFDIPSGLGSLELHTSIRSTHATEAVELHLRFNQDATLIYDVQWVQASNASIVAATRVAQNSSLFAVVAAANAPANYYAASRLLIPNYDSDIADKEWISSTSLAYGTSAGFLWNYQMNGHYRSRLPIWHLALLLNLGSFSPGCWVKVYGGR